MIDNVKIMIYKKSKRKYRRSIIRCVSGCRSEKLMSSLKMRPRH